MCPALPMHSDIHRRAAAACTSYARRLRFWATLQLPKMTSLTSLTRLAGFSGRPGSALAGAAALMVSFTCHAMEPLPDVLTMPVTIVADRLLEGGGGGKYLLSAYTGKGMQVIDKGPQRVLLNSGAVPHPMLGRNRFYLRVTAVNPSSYVAIELVSTSKRCLITTVDDRLNQAYVVGRVVEITPFLAVSDPVRLPRIGEMHSICTADSGELTLYFATPALDMLRLMVISHSASGIRMAATSFLSEMPINP